MVAPAIATDRFVMSPHGVGTERHMPGVRGPRLRFTRMTPAAAMIAASHDRCVALLRQTRFPMSPLAVSDDFTFRRGVAGDTHVFCFCFSWRLFLGR